MPNATKANAKPPTANPDITFITRLVNWIQTAIAAIMAQDALQTKYAQVPFVSVNQGTPNAMIPASTPPLR